MVTEGRYPSETALAIAAACDDAVATARAGRAQAARARAATLDLRAANEQLLAAARRSWAAVSRRR